MATKSPSRARPGRPLALLLLALVALNGFVFWKGWTPRQGLDLVGGTSVILTPKGSKPSGGALASAVDIIRQRVNGTGVSSTEVVVEGDNIRVSLPSVGRTEALAVVGTTAELTFRGVVQGPLQPGPFNTSPTPKPSASGSAKPSTTPSKAATPTPSATAPKRAMAAALFPNQTSPSPTATVAVPSSTPAPATGSPQPAPSPSATVSQAELTRDLTTADCTSPEGREAIRIKYGDPRLDHSEIVSCQVEGQSKYLLGPAEMTGKDIRSAVATIDQQGTGEWIVNLTMKNAKKWGDLTEKYAQKPLGIVLDGLTYSAPNVSGRIDGGVATISGSFTEKSARSLANVLKYGALPVQFEKSQTQSISPTLGKKSLHGGLEAGLIGLGLVIVYALLYYRGLGLVTVMGLAVFAGFNFALITILGHTIGFTLTLAGIAGVIVSIGITADSYVVFYERLKDEAKEGKTLRQSVERGFQRAFRTILAADFVSFLAAATLYLISIGEVRGFAFTLGLATILDVIIAYCFTRPVVTLLVRTALFNKSRFVGISSAVAPTPAVPATKEA